MWFLIIAALAIVLFMVWATRKPLHKPNELKLPKDINSDLPWALQKHHVSAEAMRPFEGAVSRKALFEEMITRMGWAPYEEEISRAILFALEIALHNDDYGKVGIEYEEPEFVEKQLKKLEFELVDNELYSQYNFYSHSLIALEDMLAQRRPKEEKKVIREAIQNYTEKIKEIQPQLKKKFTGITSSEIGSRGDREIFYFKMAVTNYLRGKDFIPDLDRLYYVYGLNYQIEDAFTKVTRELPIFEKVLNQGLHEVATLELIDLQRFVQAELRQTDSKKSLSD